MLDQKPARNRELSTGLLRQRRNLLISSIALIIFVALGFELEQVRILGNIARVNSPNSVPVIIVIVHSYFTLRYWQYYLEENHKPNWVEVIKHNIEESEREYFSKKARSKLDNIYKFSSINLFYPRYKELTWGESERIIADESISIFTKKVRVNAQIYSQDRFEVFTEENEEYSYKVRPKDGSWIILHNTSDHNHGSGVIIEDSIKCNKLKLIKYKVTGFIKYLFVQSDFSDYQLPIFLSFIAFTFSGLVYFGDIKT